MYMVGSSCCHIVTLAHLCLKGRSHFVLICACLHVSIITELTESNDDTTHTSQFVWSFPRNTLQLFAALHITSQQHARLWRSYMLLQNVAECCVSAQRCLLICASVCVDSTHVCVYPHHSALHSCTVDT